MAATDDETALVWVETALDGTPQIAFTLFSSRLDAVSKGRIADPAFAAIPPASATAQVAALRSGWVVLASVGATLTLYTLDRLGEVVATNTLDSMAEGFDISLAVLVSRPGGGAMIAWGSLDNYAAVVSADGLHVTTPVQLPYDLQNVGPTLPSLVNATYAAGNFQAALSANCELGPGCVEIVTVASDGTIAGTFQAPGVTAALGVLLESGTDDLRLLYGADCGTTSFDPCLMWERMSPTGTALAPPAVIQHAAANLVPNAAVADGADSYLSFDVPIWSSSLVHAGPDGAFIGDPKPIAMGGSAGAIIVRQGSNLIAAWVAEARIEVALLAP